MPARASSRGSVGRSSAWKAELELGLGATEEPLELVDGGMVERRGLTWVEECWARGPDTPPTAGIGLGGATEDEEEEEKKKAWGPG